MVSLPSLVQGRCLQSSSYVGSNPTGTSICKYISRWRKDHCDRGKRGDAVFSDNLGQIILLVRIQLY